MHKSLAIVLTLSLVGLALSQGEERSKRKLPAVRIAVAPVIDGSLDDEAWKSVPVATPFINAYTGQPTEDRTEARLAYDDKALYAAFYCHDSKPDQIVGREIQPGTEFEGEDFVVLMLDTYGTRQFGQLSRFLVNPLGTTNESIAGGRSTKREWRGQWTAATKKVADGWIAEMAIPWGVLNYPGGASLDMDVNFVRNQQRTNVTSRWSDLTPSFRGELMGIWQGVQPPKANAKRRFEFLGYAAPEYDKDKGSGVRAGLDIRTNFTNDLSGVASLNPDFKNIEGQIAGIEFTRTERYIDDTRPFFTEGSDYFHLTPEYTFGQMFYSQRVPYFDYGAKAFGRVNKSTTLGALVAVDTDDSTNAVVNLGKEFGPNASLGVFATARDEKGVGTNTVAGHRSSYRFARNWFVESESATMWEKGDRKGAYAYALAYDMPRLFLVARHSKVDGGFRPALGFIPFTDEVGTYLFGEYNNQVTEGALKNYGANLFANVYEHTDGRPFHREFSPSVYVVTRSDHRVNLFTNMDTFEGERSHVSGLNLTFNQSNRFKRFGFGYSGGKRGNDKTQYLNAFANIRLFGRVVLGAETNSLNYAGHGTLSVATLSWEMDKRRSLSARWVNRDGSANWYLAYRNAGLAGAEWYVIVGDPNAAKFQNRVSVKVVWAF
ncbi:MAG: carbohydrate binding family 9 domain-containing protein [Fimbriimonadaceae bacterium]|nr:carbohydrate binding family 9 domain-containing protein [Fimbriimonadaceae bacterium]